MTAPKKKVVLLNPPSRELQLRDLYCSITSKGNYCWSPIDLVVLSGLLKADFELSVVDAIAEPLRPERAMRRILEAEPSAVIGMTGSSSWREDKDFLSDVKSRTGCLMAVCGDLCLSPEPWFMESHPWLDAMITDFTSPGVPEYLRAGGKPPGPLPGVRHRSEGKIVEGSRTAPGKTFTYPVPRHELFPLRRYRLPYVTRYPLASVLTNFGCRFACSYCIQSNAHLGYRRRELDNILEELVDLHERGVRELYFRDPLFEARPQEAKALCEAMGERFDFTWSCNSRVDTISRELIVAMRDAGCRCVAFGFESANEEVLKRHDKPITLEQSLKAVGLCKRLGVRVAGYFILGLPGESYEDALKTIRFAVESGIDYASFAVPSPDYGTNLRDQAIAGGRIGPDYRIFNRSRSGISLSDRLSTRDLNRLLRKAGRSFYLRPSYILKTLREAKGGRQTREVLKAGWAVLRGCLLPRWDRTTP